MSRPVWEPEDKENARSYARFCVFRDLGPRRSLPMAAGLMDVSLKTVERNSAAHKWYPRALAYDEYVDSLVREQNEKQILEMAARHSSQAKSLQERAFSYAFAKEMDSNDLTLSKKVWILQSIAGTYERMALLERLSRGEPTENIRQEDDGLLAIANALKEKEDE